MAAARGRAPEPVSIEAYRQRVQDEMVAAWFAMQEARARMIERHRALEQAWDDAPGPLLGVKADRPATEAPKPVRLVTDEWRPAHSNSTADWIGTIGFASAVFLFVAAVIGYIYWSRW